MAFCKHCTCQSCTDERNSIEKRFIKTVLRLSTENRTSSEIQNNIDREDEEKKVSLYDILYAEIPNERTFSVKFKNCKGHRDTLLYRFKLWRAKRNLLAQIKMITNKHSVIVSSLNDDMLDYL